MSNQIELKRTCFACPEQYDAYLNGEKVGYLRLRHGSFTVQVPDPRGEYVYEADTIGDGIFDESEREYHLDKALAAIMGKVTQ